MGHDKRGLLAADVGADVADRGMGASVMIAGLLTFCAGPLGRWIVIGLLVTAAVAAAGMRLYNAGYDKRDAELSAETAEANQRARIAERGASARLSKLAADHLKEVSNAQTQIDRLRADVRRGARRLSVVTAGLSARADPTAAGGTGRETRADLDPATAEALVAIAADGDSAIRQTNALIDAYQIAAEVCGK